LPTTWWHIAEVAASQHFINASTAAKIHKYLSREVMQQFWQYARCMSVAATRGTLSENGIFPVKTRRPFLSVREPKAKYGVSHFWLCVGQYGVCVLARV